MIFPTPIFNRQVYATKKRPIASTDCRLKELKKRGDLRAITRDILNDNGNPLNITHLVYEFAARGFRVNKITLSACLSDSPGFTYNNGFTYNKEKGGWSLK
ncbi:hypothetical protein KAR91_76430 [Candidatus Pacearchaeota archaeon]|nr:hypothetical protein [Candidatus Pacearchaeota archaeon]